MSSFHRHVSKGSMKDAHNTDDRQERAQLHTDGHLKDQIIPLVSGSKAIDLARKIAEAKAALAKRDKSIEERS